LEWLGMPLFCGSIARGVLLSAAPITINIFDNHSNLLYIKQTFGFACYLSAIRILSGNRLRINYKKGATDE